MASNPASSSLAACDKDIALRDHCPASWRRVAGALLAAFLLSGIAHAQSPELIEKSEQGHELMAAGKFEEAVPIYRQLVKAVPGNPGLLLNLGMALHLAGHSREAIAPLTQALKIDANVLPAYLFLGAS